MMHFITGQSYEFLGSEVMRLGTQVPNFQEYRHFGGIVYHLNFVRYVLYVCCGVT